ncbi:MAG TPA: hypothetical protein VF832_09240, partial [Longimicrobiales bacterium]
MNEPQQIPPATAAAESARRERWLRPLRFLPALAAGAALGIAVEAGAALMLYSGLGLLSAAGFILGVALAALAAGIWVGTPDPETGPEELGSAAHWITAVAALLFAALY